MTFDLVVRNGSVVGPAGVIRADVGIVGEQIAALGSGLHGLRELDATGLLVIPGGVDGHVHFSDESFPPFAPVTADSMASGTIAAAFGGVTTVIDFAQPAPGERYIVEVRRRLQEVSGEAFIDYGLHLNIRDAREELLKNLAEVFACGISSVKLFMAYEGYRLNDGEILRVMNDVAALGGLAILHAENYDVICERRRKHGRRPETHIRTCPSAAEGEAVQRALMLSELAGVEILIFHVSCREGVEALAQVQESRAPVHGETLSTYLSLSDAVYDKKTTTAWAAMVNPPIRGGEHRDALWSGLRDGTLEIISTDHGPCMPRELLSEQPQGLPAVETRLAAVYSFGVRSGLISLERWVDACSTRPAEIFRLKRKGRVAPGYDADIVLFDPAKQVTVTPGQMHSVVDYDPLDGITLTGWPTTTISRGEVIIHDGLLTTTRPRGRFVER